MILPIEIQLNTNDSTEKLREKLEDIGQEVRWVTENYLTQESRDQGYSEMVWKDEDMAEYHDLLIEEADLIQDEIDSRVVNTQKIDINMHSMGAGL